MTKHCLSPYLYETPKSYGSSVISRLCYLGYYYIIFYDSIFEVLILNGSAIDLLESRQGIVSSKLLEISETKKIP